MVRLGCNRAAREGVRIGLSVALKEKCSSTQVGDGLKPCSPEQASESHPVLPNHGRGGSVGRMTFFMRGAVLS